MFCSQCGKDIPEDSEFCRFCGKPNIAAGAKAQPTQPQPPVQPFGSGQGTAPMPLIAPGMGGPAKPRKRWVLPVAILVALVVAAGVTLGLVFGLKGSASAASGPERTVNSFFTAVGQGDVDGIIATFSRDFVKELRDAYGSSYKGSVDDFFFMGTSDTQFSDLRFQTDITGDTALVKVVGGSLTYKDENGKKVTEQVTSGDGMSFDLVKVGNDWFIEGSSFPDILYGSSSSYTNDNTTNEPVTPVIPPDYTNATMCWNCGGYGMAACGTCYGAGGYNTDVAAVCPDCGGTLDCYYCGGTGDDPYYYYDYCPICNGWGFCSTCSGTGYVNEAVWEGCYGCGGSGYVTCPVCSGAGWL